MKPNILIIVTDDQREGLSVMPATRRFFVRNGTSFKSAFSTTPLCCPSRASIFSGMYSHNHGVLETGEQANLDQQLTLQRYLQLAGYRSGIFGKFLNHWDPRRNPPYWDDWAALVSGPGHYYRGSKWNINGHVSHVKGYSTTILRRNALAFLEDTERSDDDPWFMYLAPAAPHFPFTPENKYAHVRVPGGHRNPAMRERDLSDKPPRLVGKGMGPAAHWRRMRKAQFRTLMSVDDMVGQVSRRLKELNEDRPTLAIFLSDNGYMWGEHKMGGKRRPYTPAIHIPMMIRWPGHVPGGVVRSDPVANIDVVPTVIDAVDAPDEFEAARDGNSLMGPARRKRILIEYAAPGRSKFVDPWASIRTNRFQYTEWYRGRGRVRFREYYNLRRDPWELRNLLGDRRKANNPAVRRLTRSLRRYRRCAGASCP